MSVTLFSAEHVPYEWYDGMRVIRTEESILPEEFGEVGSIYRVINSSKEGFFICSAGDWVSGGRVDASCFIPLVEEKLEVEDFV
jgi:hypothetical protein